jgi:PleD family two-component response regulator
MNRFFVLVANDRQDSLFLSRMTRALKQFGKAILTSESELPALPNRISLVILDAFDVQDAAGLVKELRQSRPSLPIVVFLLEHDLDIARAVFKMGATDCLVKGVDEDTFLLRLKNEYLKLGSAQ